MTDRVDIVYDRNELRAITRAFKAMDAEAIDQARAVSNRLASEVVQAVQQESNIYGLPATRVAYGARVSKSSKIGEFSFGYAAQRFSGGGTTQMLWPAIEFGSNHYTQFRPWSGRYGKGSKGKFIYPTLRAMQPYLVKEWEQAFDGILRKWD